MNMIRTVALDLTDPIKVHLEYRIKGLAMIQLSVCFLVKREG